MFLLSSFEEIWELFWNFILLMLGVGSLDIVGGEGRSWVGKFYFIYLWFIR